DIDHAHVELDDGEAEAHPDEREPGSLGAVHPFEGRRGTVRPNAKRGGLTGDRGGPAPRRGGENPRGMSESGADTTPPDAAARTSRAAPWVGRLAPYADHGPLPVVLLGLTVVTGVVDAV